MKEGTQVQEERAKDGAWESQHGQMSRAGQVSKATERVLIKSEKPRLGFQKAWRREVTGRLANTYGQNWSALVVHASRGVWRRLEKTQSRVCGGGRRGNGAQESRHLCEVSGGKREETEEPWKVEGSRARF